MDGRTSLRAVLPYISWDVSIYFHYISFNKIFFSSDHCILNIELTLKFLWIAHSNELSDALSSVECFAQIEFCISWNCIHSEFGISMQQISRKCIWRSKAQNLHIHSLCSTNIPVNWPINLFSYIEFKDLRILAFAGTVNCGRFFGTVSNKDIFFFFFSNCIRCSSNSQNNTRFILWPHF